LDLDWLENTGPDDLGRTTGDGIVLITWPFVPLKEKKWVIDIAQISGLIHTRKNSNTTSTEAYGEQLEGW